MAGGRRPIYTERNIAVTVRLPQSLVERMDRDANTRNLMADVAAGSDGATSRAKIVAEAVAKLYRMKLPIAQEG